MENLEEGYYMVNDTSKVMYWNGELWQKAVKDKGGRYGGYVMNLEKQPRIKTVEKIKIL